jgi:hypothetical protein
MLNFLDSILPAKAKEFFKTGGINIESIFGLLNGGATPRKVAETVAPIVATITPALGDAIEHLTKKYQGEQVMLQIYNTSDEADQQVTGFSVVRINADSGQVDYLESYQFDYLPHFIVDKMEEAKAIAQLVEAQPQISTHLLPAA